jgi:hypothetical protein
MPFGRWPLEYIETNSAPEKAMVFGRLQVAQPKSLESHWGSGLPAFGTTTTKTIHRKQLPEPLSNSQQSSDIRNCISIRTGKVRGGLMVGGAEKA